MFVREFVDGQSVEQALLVRGREVRSRADGGTVFELKLGDRTGTVAAMLRENCERLTEVCTQGCVVWVSGHFDGTRLELHFLRAARDEERDMRALLDGPPRSAAQMEADLRELVSTVQNGHLRALLDRLLGPASPTWPQFRDAPAAKRYHQAYQHGLLEHALSVAQAVSAISATFPGIDRDVAVTGALLHDIGKLEAYTSDPCAIDLTDLGKLQGEIPLGYYRVRRLIEELPGFPEPLAAAVLHIILAHHGALEHGSPVLPATREATLVHMIDNLGGRLGSFDRLEKELPQGAAWSGFDRALGGGAYFAERAA
ncbi:MAG TPA: HD domain-containing protein [Solirubrobacteraceae bacterium]|jgi:3'-5' exoribonuclease